MPDTASSRYARMHRILDAAAAGATNHYQGYGPFWHLPLAALLEVELYGVRMIAPSGAAASLPLQSAAPPPMAAGCCHAPAASSDPAPPAALPVARPHPGRGAASGLIKGLKGLAPFDGSQFPPLPWGGQRVAPEDIAVIERWIDDGCPAARVTAP